MLSRSIFLSLAIGLVALSGCGPAKLDLNKTYTVDQPQIIMLDPQSKPQKFTIDFDSADSPVTVLLLKDADLPKDEDGSITPNSKAIAFKSGEKKGNFTADVPANTATRVVVKSPSKTSVKLHITN